MEALLMPLRQDFESLVKAHHRGVWRYLRLLGCETSQADDLTQETFIVFLQKDFIYRSEAATAGFLRNIARFIYLESVRSDARRREIDLDEADALFAHSAQDGGDDYVDALRDCVETLQNRAREAVELKYREKLEAAEIAHRLGMKPTGLKTLLQRARAHLRDCVERRLRNE